MLLGQPLSTALLPAGPSYTHTATDRTLLTSICMLGRKEKKIKRERLREREREKQRARLYLEGGSRAKSGEVVAEKAKGSRRCSTDLEGKAPPQAPLQLFLLHALSGCLLHHLSQLLSPR